jgi:hypothetical protein
MDTRFSLHRTQIEARPVDGGTNADGVNGANVHAGDPEAGVPARDVEYSRLTGGARPEGAAPAAKGWVSQLVSRLTGGADALADLPLPKTMIAELRADAKNWIARGEAPGPLHINGDLGRMRRGRKLEGPESLTWLFGKGGARELDSFSVESFLGREVRIEPAYYDRGLRTGDAHVGRVVEARERYGFITWKLAGEDGATFEVPFSNDWHATSYVGILHGHLVRETCNHAFNPSRDHVGLLVVARELGVDARGRFAGAPITGEVVAQSDRHLEVRDREGALVKVEAPEGGHLQVVVVPSEELAASGTRSWREAFAALEDLRGQPVRLCFDPISTKSSIEVILKEIERQPGGGVRVHYRMGDGLEGASEFSSPNHVIVIPSTVSRKLMKSTAGDAPNYLHQIVDATLVESKVKSSGYGQNWWVDEKALKKVRGEVVDQTPESITVRALNGETVKLDLAPFSGDEPLIGLHELSAESYVHVRPLGLWADR